MTTTPPTNNPVRTGRGKRQQFRGSAAAQMRQDKALKLWISGLTYPQIAEKLEFKSRSGAYMAVTAALARFNVEAEETAAHGRAIAIARLRPLWKRALDNALSADGTAKDIMAAAQIADRLQRLEGVKDPAHEIRLTVETELDQEIRTLTEALQRASTAVVPDEPARG